MNRRRARRALEMVGFDLSKLSLSSQPDKLPSYAPSLSTPVASAIAPSLASEVQLKAPEGVQQISTAASGFQLRAPTLQSANSSAAPSVAKTNFLSREAFGGFKVWQLMLGGAGLLAVGVGIYKMAANPSRVGSVR